MSDNWLYYLIGVPIFVFFTYLRIKDYFAPQRIQPTQDGIALAVFLLVLAGYFKATVFEHPEARIGWFLGLLCGGAVGFFDLRVTRIRNTPGGIFAYSSRLVALGFLVAGELWTTSHGGRRELSIENASESPASMFFCTTLFTYVVVYINGLYSGRRFESAGPRRKAVERKPDRIEYGRRRGRR